MNRAKTFVFPPPSEKRSTVTMVITPAIAKEMLERNQLNRRLKPTLVARIAEEMVRGRFAHTHQGIAFAIDGILLDGQHRLAAVVMSEVDVTMDVTFNCPSVILDRIDTGHSRRIADVMHLLGKTGACYELPLLRVCMLLNGQTPNSPTSAEAWEEVIAPYQVGITATLGILSRTQRPWSAPIMGAVAYVHKAAPAVTERFFRRLIAGEDLKRGEPVMTYRELVFNQHGGGGRGGSNLSPLSTKLVAAVYATHQHRTLVKLQESDDALKWAQKAYR